MIQEEVLLVGGTNDGCRTVVHNTPATITMHEKGWSEQALDVLHQHVPATSLDRPRYEQYRRVELAPGGDGQDAEVREVLYAEVSHPVDSGNAKQLWARSRSSR